MVAGIRNGGVTRNPLADQYRDPNEYIPDQGGTRQQVHQRGRDMGFTGTYGNGAFQNWLNESAQRRNDWEGERVRALGGTPDEAYMNTVLDNGLTNRDMINAQRGFGYNGPSNDRMFRSWLNQTGQTALYGNHIQSLIDQLDAPIPDPTTPDPTTTVGSTTDNPGVVVPGVDDDDLTGQGRR